MIFFTSDLHLGHENSIRFTDRPFETVEQMNNVLIENINETVGERDELWVLGDFAFKIDMQQVRELRKRIKCRHLHLVKGNHDKDYSQETVFETVQDYKQLKTDYGVFILFHYPILEWNRAHYGAVHLHGHIHSTGDYNAENLQKKFADRFTYKHSSKIKDLELRIYDVGVDANDYRPVSLEKLAQLMQLSRIRGGSDEQ